MPEAAAGAAGGEPGGHRVRGFLLPAVATLTCPCHLPLVVALLAGTVLGGFLAQNLPLLLALFAGLFAGSLWLWARELAPASEHATAAAPAQTTPAPRQAEPLQVQILKTGGCASCRGVERSWERLRPVYEGRVQVQIVDLLDRPELASQHRLLATPAVVIGARLRAQGALDVASLKRLLDDALTEGPPAASQGEGAHV